jgi:hypothetical protein
MMPGTFGDGEDWIFYLMICIAKHAGRFRWSGKLWVGRVPVTLGRFEY